MQPLKSPGDYASQIRRRIRLALAERDQSAAGLARLVGWTQSYLARRMAGRTPFDLSDLACIAAALEIPLVDLVDDRERVAA